MAVLTILLFALLLPGIIYVFFSLLPFAIIIGILLCIIKLAMLAL